MPRIGSVKVYSPRWDVLINLHGKSVKQFFKDGKIVQVCRVCFGDGRYPRCAGKKQPHIMEWFSTKDFPNPGAHPLHESTGRVIEKIAAEKFPLIVQGGLTRTEKQPRIKPYPTRWPETTTPQSRSTRQLIPAR